jgi:hypothetical protein
MTNDETGSEVGTGVQVVGLRSGATVSVHSDDRGETIVLRSAGGSVDLSIRMTEQGPVLSLKGVRLEIEATEELALKCREFSIDARDGLRLTSGGDLQVRSEAAIALRSAGSTSIDGDYVNLNCLDRTGYHDQDTRGAEAVPEPPAGP